MKFLSGIRKKILFISFLALLGILAAGYVGYKSLGKLLGTVDNIVVPDKSVALMHDILADLSLINNYNRMYSITSDYKYQKNIEKVAQAIHLKADTLANQFLTDTLQKQQVDSLKLLIDDIKTDSKKLAAAKRKADVNSITSRLIREITDNVKNDTTIFKDSTYVLKSTTSEIKVSDFTIEKIDSLTKLNQGGKNMGFLKKLGFLFSGKQPSNLVDTIYVKPKRQVDTLTTVNRDSTFLISSQEFVKKLDSILNKFSKEEAQSIKYVDQLELEVTARNNEVIEKARGLLLELNKETVYAAFDEINYAYQISTRSKNLMLFIISFFVVSGAVLIILIFIDISKSSYYQQKLETAKKNAEESAKAKIDFLAKMSHEIRSPLTSIIGFSNLIKTENDYVKSIKNSSLKMLNTANEILDMAKLDTGIFEIHEEPFDLINFLELLVFDFEQTAQTQQLTFIKELPQNKHELFVKSDAFRLNQILTNLLSNAFKFTNKGHVKIATTIERETETHLDLKISVEDTGAGIPPDDLHTIFEDYKQSGSLHHKKLGFGLGLSIVKKLVTALNGTVEVESVPDEGTIFKLLFNFEKTQSTTKLKHDHQLPSNLLHSRSILILDDDPTILKLFSILLKKYGANVISHSDPDEAIDFLENNFVDLCLIDIQLAGRNGADVCKQIREKDKFKKHKIIAITANLIENTEDNLRQIGFDDLILKPVMEYDLILTIATNLKIDFPADRNNDKVGVQESKKHNELKYIDKFTMGDEKLQEEIIMQFVEDTLKDLEALGGATKTKNTNIIKNILHKLTSRLRQFEFNDLATSATSIEQKIKNSGILPTTEVMDFIEDGVKNIQDFYLSNNKQYQEH